MEDFKKNKDLAEFKDALVDEVRCMTFIYN